MTDEDCVLAGSGLNVLQTIYKLRLLSTLHAQGHTERHIERHAQTHIQTDVKSIQTTCIYNKQLAQNKTSQCYSPLHWSDSNNLYHKTTTTTTTTTTTYRWRWCVDLKVHIAGVGHTTYNDHTRVLPSMLCGGTWYGQGTDAVTVGWLVVRT